VTFVDNLNGTGTLGITPVAGTTGTYPLTFSATSSIATVSQSFTLTITLPATRLVVTQVNGGANPSAGVGFAVVVQAWDSVGPAVVTASTAVSLSRQTGTGTLGGTLTGTIAAGSNSVTISGVTYTKAESGVSITATRTSGNVLTSGTSATFTVNPGALASYLLTPSVTTVSAGAAVLVTIQPLDAFGNPRAGSAAVTITGRNAADTANNLNVQVDADRNGTYGDNVVNTAAGATTFNIRNGVAETLLVPGHEQRRRRLQLDRLPGRGRGRDCGLGRPAIRAGHSIQRRQRRHRVVPIDRYVRSHDAAGCGRLLVRRGSLPRRHRAYHRRSRTGHQSQLRIPSQPRHRRARGYGQQRGGLRPGGHERDAHRHRPAGWHAQSAQLGQSDSPDANRAEHHSVDPRFGPRQSLLRLERPRPWRYQLAVRRAVSAERFTNNTGQAVTRLRVRIVGLSTFPANSGEWDLRAIDGTGTVTSSAGTVVVAGLQPMTLELPVQQFNGGAVNSTLTLNGAASRGVLANGATVDVHLLFGVAQEATNPFVVSLIVEALP
jgi:hypothetical protein